MEDIDLPPQKRDILWPYRPGEAVYLVRGEALSKPRIGTPAVVVRVSGPNESHEFVRNIGRYVVLQRPDGRRVRAEAWGLIYRGYCPDCQRAAHERNGTLICPLCKQPALSEIPPDTLLARWEPKGERGDLIYRHRECLTTGCTMNEAIKRVDARLKALYSAVAQSAGLDDYRAWCFPFNTREMISEFKWLAEIGDVAGAQTLIDDAIMQRAEHYKNAIRLIQQMPPIDGEEFGPR